MNTIGSEKMNPFLIGVSLFATLLSTISYMGIPGEMLGKGPVNMTDILSYPFIFLVVGFVLLPVYMRVKVTKRHLWCWKTNSALAFVYWAPRFL